MAFVYRTLQRPEDIVRWTAANIVMKREADGQSRRILRNIQDKTSAAVDIEITPEIEAILEQTKIGDSLPAVSPCCARARGNPIHMRGCQQCSAVTWQQRCKRGALPSFWLFTTYDLKGKGATDMWLDDEPITKIQMLCGHESVTTTEIYVKCRWRGTVRPNTTKLVT